MTKRMTVAQFKARKPAAKRRDLEGPIHMQCLNHLRMSLPGAVIHHSANELDLHGDKRAKAIAQNKAKAKGMLPGFPDLLVIWNGHVWAFEVKAPGNGPTKEQAAVGEAIIANGGKWAVVYSYDELAALVREWAHEAGPSVELRGVVT